jgi:peptidylprolyl isomerase
VRRLATLAVAAGLVASLAACSSADDSAAGCTPPASSGNASSVVTATGDFGGSTTVAEFPTPLTTSKLQVSVLSQGDGEVVQPGDYVDFVATQYDSSTGDVAYDAQTARYGASDQSDLNKIFECVTVGSRIAAVVPTGESAEDTSSAVLVIDVLDRIQRKADGRSKLPTRGFPAVVTAPDGTPGITVQDEAAPTTLKSAVLKSGNGATVAEGDSVILQYSVYNWGSPATLLDSSWTAAAPRTYAAKAFDTTDGTGLFPGTEDAVIGQKVGSQVIVIVPPDKSYPSGAAAPDNGTADTTRIYVLDILKIVN